MKPDVDPYVPSCDSVATRPSLLGEASAKGIRLTTQRRLLMSVIQAADRHLSAQEILDRARREDPSLDRATVYRTLDLLKHHRLIDELDLMHLKGECHYYEVRTERDHIHLACFGCGRIEEVAPPLFEALKREITKLTGFDVRVSRLEIGGRCRACSANPN